MSEGAAPPPAISAKANAAAVEQKFRGGIANDWLLRFRDARLEQRYIDDTFRLCGQQRTIAFVILGLVFIYFPVLAQCTLNVPSVELHNWEIRDWAVLGPYFFVAALYNEGRLPGAGPTARSMGLICALAVVLVLGDWAFLKRAEQPVPQVMPFVIYLFVCFGAGFNWSSILAIVGSTLPVVIAVQLWHEHVTAPVELTFAWNLAVMSLVLALRFEQERTARAAWADLKRAEHFATTDPLTLALNRRGLDDAFERMLRLAARQKRGITLAMLDLDHFKGLNDRHGHAYGDEALTRVGQWLKETVHRPMDFVGRSGGEEFALAWYDTTVDFAQEIGPTLCEGIRKLDMENRASKVARVLTASVGVGWFIPGSTVGSRQWLRRVDACLYRAKERGRNRAEFERLYRTDTAGETA